MSDSLYERVFESATVGIAVHEPGSARIEAVNRAYADALGYDASVLVGASLPDIAARDPAALGSAIGRALNGGSEQVEAVLADADGTARRVTLAFGTIPDGERSRLVSTLQSVGDREGHVPTASERRLEVALAGTNTGVWEWDMGTGEVIWTESMEELFALEPGTFEGTFEAFAERVHPDDLPAVQAAIEQAVERDETFETDYRIRRDDGERRWVHARGELHDTADGAGRMVGVLTDVTDRKDSEQELSQQERLYRQLVERLPEAYYTIDSDWRFTFCNETVAERLGRPTEEIVGERLYDVYPAAAGSVVERAFRRVMETGFPETVEYQYASGGRWVSIQVYPYDDGIAAISTDISEERAALRSVLDAAPVMIFRFDSDGTFTEIRGEILSRLGLEPDDLLDENLFEVYADNEQVTAAARRALDGDSFRFTITLAGIVLETHYTPVLSDGEVSEVIGVSMDVTELHRQRERMEFFNSILRHDVLNGMTIIKMRGELLADELDGEHGQYARTIVDWCDATTSVTKRVREVIETLATPDEEQRLEPIDVSAILDRKLGELANAYPAVTFENDVPGGVLVRADELLADVLGNVLSNSIEHNGTDGLRIETTVTAAAADRTVRIAVADNGTGIPDDRKQSVFRRGETAHAKETGSGFGLFFVDVMVEKYGGDVRIENSDGGGARFVIELASGEASR